MNEPPALSAGPAVVFSRGKHRLRLEVVERNADDFIVEGHVAVDRFTAVAAGTFSLEELLAWQVSLQSLYDTLGGRATLSQDGLVVSVVGDGRGHLSVEGAFDSDVGWGDGSHAVLRFTLPPLDQTDLPAAIAELDAVRVMPDRQEGCPDD